MRRDLPDNLYERSGYYSWRNPDTGREYGLGRDKADAIAQAREANRFIEDKRAGQLVTRLAGDVRTIGAFADRYRERLDQRPAADVTRYEHKRRLVHIERDLGHVAIGPRQEDAAAITAAAAEWLRKIAKAGKHRSAQTYRGTLIDLFAEIAAAGWLSVNPIEVIRLEPAKVRRARLTFDDFWKVYNAAEQLYPWVRRSMELGLVTLQRREDIAPMGFRDQADGRLLVEQGKSLDSETGIIQTRLRIPLSIRLHAVGWSLEDIIKLCRDNVLSRYLVHHHRTRGKAAAGDPVYPKKITAAFAEARDMAAIAVPEGKTPPTFHEIRSLGIRLYQKQGYDPQDLAGHKDPDTTRLYTDTRGVEWIDVAA